MPSKHVSRVERPAIAPGHLGHMRSRLPGLALVLAAAAVSLTVSRAFVAVSALIVAIILGVSLRNAGLLPAATRPGTQWATKRLLRAGVVLLGLQLSVPEVLALRPGELLTILLTVVATFAVTWWLGGLLRLSRATSVLLATGFAICGASAIAAMSSVVEQEDSNEQDVATSIAMVTLFGSLMILVMPLSQGLAGLDDHQMGIWIGASVHEVAQVVAAASAVSATALAVAVVVKLGRVVLLAPMVALMGIAERRRTAPGAIGVEPRPRGQRPPVVPLFVLGFLAMVGVRSVGFLPDEILTAASWLTTGLLTGAMFGLGTGVHLTTLVRTGGRAMLLAAMSTATALGVSLAGIYVFA